MAQTRKRYPAEFKRRMVELATYPLVIKVAGSE